MSTPRQIRASEVVKGMRVRVEREYPASGPRLAYTVTFEGVVSEATDTRFTIVASGPNDYTFWHDSSDHPVTVLAEPEPEWVEGAWYWVELQEKRTLMRRVGCGWSALADTVHAFHSDTNVTVLGRVLIVDWPGDKAVQLLTNAYRPGVDWSGVDWECSLLQSLADAIRTQGGAR